MIPALLWTIGAVTFVAEVTAIVVLIVRNKPAQTGKASEPADLERIGGMLAEAREDLTEPEPVPADVEGVQIGRRVPGATIRPKYDGEPDTEQQAAPPLELLERLHAGLTDGPPWRRAVGAELAIAHAQRSESVTWGPYRPRHAKDGAITQTFDAIVATSYESTKEIAVSVA